MPGTLLDAEETYKLFTLRTVTPGERTQITASTTTKYSGFVK